MSNVLYLFHSNPVFSSSTRHRSGSMGCLTPYPSDPPDELNRSFDLSSPRRYSSLTPHTVARSPRPLREAHKALEESEKRRELLVEKLKDARSTIQVRSSNYVLSFIHSFIHSFIYSFIHSFIHSLPAGYPGSSAQQRCQCSCRISADTGDLIGVGRGTALLKLNRQ